MCRNYVLESSHCLDQDPPKRREIIQCDHPDICCTWPNIACVIEADSICEHYSMSDVPANHIEYLKEAYSGTSRYADVTQRVSEAHNNIVAGNLASTCLDGILLEEDYRKLARITHVLWKDMCWKLKHSPESVTHIHRQLLRDFDLALSKAKVTQFDSRLNSNLEQRLRQVARPVLPDTLRTRQLSHCIICMEEFGESLGPSTGHASSKRQAGQETDNPQQLACPGELHCGHVFCLSCIRQHLKTDNKPMLSSPCPLCRAPIPSVAQKFHKDNNIPSPTAYISMVYQAALGLHPDQVEGPEYGPAPDPTVEAAPVVNAPVHDGDFPFRMFPDQNYVDLLGQDDRQDENHLEEINDLEEDNIREMDELGRSVNTFVEGLQEEVRRLGRLITGQQNAYDSLSAERLEIAEERQRMRNEQQRWATQLEFAAATRRQMTDAYTQLRINNQGIRADNEQIRADIRQIRNLIEGMNFAGNSVSNASSTIDELD